jgi:alpha-L-fucosidase
MNYEIREVDKMQKNEELMKWWKEAKFGMIIHWGLYSYLGGEWKGQKMDYIGEWIMSKFKISIKEYEALAEEFNPIKFDADLWVRTAKRAGMKYIIYTAKHHEGFAMYNSKVDSYNITEASKFKRDPLKELAEACKKHGLKLGLYYSQALDWHEMDGGGTEPELPLNYGMSWGNNWDFPKHEEKNFERYFQNKVKPQIKELLTNYGSIALIWFDCPFTISKLQCEELYNLVKSLQQNCIINSRLGNGFGDYDSLGDNMIPAACLEGDWEAIATLNDTWGYKREDKNWKSSEEVLKLLTGLAGKGINYVLNIGPDEEGAFPEQSMKILNEIGDWMEKNSEAIHSTLPTPYIDDFSLGSITRNDKKLYFHFHGKVPGKLSLNGINSKVKKAYMLSDSNNMLQVQEISKEELKLNTLEVILPKTLSVETIPVLVIEFYDAVKVESGIYQQGNENIYLPAYEAKIEQHDNKRIVKSDTSASEFQSVEPDGRRIFQGSKIKIDPIGATTNWFDTESLLSWHFKVYIPGKFQIKLITSALYHNKPWSGGHKVIIEIQEKKIISTINKDEEINNAVTSCYAQAASICGEVSIEKPGNYNLKLIGEEIQFNDNVGLAVIAVQLIKIA